MRQKKRLTPRKRAAAAALLSTLGNVVKDLQAYWESTFEASHRTVSPGQVILISAFLNSYV
jgi:hypothetical protein